MTDIVVNSKSLRLELTVPTSVKDEIMKKLCDRCRPLCSKDDNKTWRIYVFLDPLEEEGFMNSLNGKGSAPKEP
ncbi:MAG: hypothetical protein A2896_01760 [Candidatus Nealsonbacteria bacterium RIFCSPLOWO2_01_FULL_43_32]|uniref:Uncharacterized protein n=1 Tax=Candidatus Nealsonbacteria bacterium RIFCSPLOWO2_01_FULL_43_32 TaxID=1801672 RepID=A0A1G2EG69_9BACT|nr:MAG: hypothetical protein A2896_01760 [Candidatus Nealsonbacteria bacterium RIFCSPLOWO2_01_FULL_43_32]